MTRHAVLFDMDDTLLLTREVKWAHHRHTAREHYGITLDDEVLRRHWGEPFDVMIGHLYQDAASVDEMRRANHASAHLFAKQPVPGAVDVVTRLLDAGHPVGVVTSTNTDMAIADLARCGFPLDRLATVQGADRTAFHKPDPRVFDPVLADLRQAGATRITYVGDALMDAQAAHAAGIDFVAVTTGLFTADEFTALGLGGLPVVADIRDLPGALEG